VFQQSNGRETSSSFGDTIIYSRMPGQSEEGFWSRFSPLS